MTEKRIVCITDVCSSIFAGGDAPKKQFSFEQTEDCCYPVFSNGESNNGLYGYTNTARVTEPSITVSARGTIGFTAIRLTPFTPIVRLISITPIQDIIDIDYLYYALSNYTPENTGTSIPQLTVPMIKKHKFRLPEKDEQKRAVKVLKQIDNILEKETKQIQKLDELIKSRFVEMFGDPISNTLGWIVDPLSNHLSVIGGYAFKSDLFVEDGIPVLRIGNINTGAFRPTNLVYWEDDALLDRYKLYPGDLVISLTGTVGKNDYGNVCILGNDYDVYYLNQRNAKLELKQTINKVYLSELLKFREIKQRLTGINRGVRQANISNKDILDLCVPIPPINSQNQFADFVTQVEKQKATVQQSIDKLEALKKSLMQEYFG